MSLISKYLLFETVGVFTFWTLSFARYDLISRQDNKANVLTSTTVILVKRVCNLFFLFDSFSCLIFSLFAPVESSSIAIHIFTSAWCTCREEEEEEQAKCATQKDIKKKDKINKKEELNRMWNNNVTYVQEVKKKEKKKNDQNTWAEVMEEVEKDEEEEEAEKEGHIQQYNIFHYMHRSKSLQGSAKWFFTPKRVYRMGMSWAGRCCRTYSK